MIDTGKMKYADEWETLEEAENYKAKWDIDNQFDVVEYSLASGQYYD